MPDSSAAWAPGRRASNHVPPAIAATAAARTNGTLRRERAIGEPVALAGAARKHRRATLRARSQGGQANRRTGCSAATASMVVARDALGLRDALVLDGRLQDHALAELIHHRALDLLPRRLMAGEMEPARVLERGAALRQFPVRDQDVGGSLVKVDADAVPRAQEREPSPRGRLGRGVEDRGRAGCAGLAAVTDAGQRCDPLLDEGGGRLHVDDLRAT